jgi:hypothetical protein
MSEGRGRMDELWARWLADGQLDEDEQRVLAEALSEDEALRTDLLGDQRIDGALSALGRTASDAEAFARRFAERVTAERDGRGFVSSVERQLAAQQRVRTPARDRRIWLLLPLAAAALLVPMALRSKVPASRPGAVPEAAVTVAPASPPGSAGRQPIIARVESASGALLLDGGRKTEAHPGASLPAGWGLVTVGPDSRAVLTFEDRTSLALDGDSALMQVSGGDGRGKEAFLARGRLTADVKPQPPGRPLLITTPQVQATVLGTRFTVTVDRSSTRVDVSQGGVRIARLSGGEATNVRSSQYAVIADGTQAMVRADLRGVALMLVGDLSLQNDDQRVKQRLESLGYLVRVRLSGPPDLRELQGVSVVLVSSSVFSLDLNTQYRDIAVPVMVWEPSLFDDFGMTGPEESRACGVAASAGEAFISLPSHPMAAGLDGSVTVVTNGHGEHRLWLNYGTPGPSAAWVATWPGRPGRALLFAYEQGAPMPGLPSAPARRVGFFFYDDGRLHLTPAGWALFDAAVTWAAGGA